MIEISDSLLPKREIAIQQGGNEKPPLILSKGETVKGTVLKSLSPHNALLLIKGSRITARTSLPLQKGRVLSLRVEDTSPVPLLKPLGAQFRSPDTAGISVMLSAIKENLWKSAFENIYHALPKEGSSLFRELITHITLRLFSKSSPELLKVLIDTSGFTWEKKLRESLSGGTILPDNLDRLVMKDLKGLSSKLIALNQENEGLQATLKKFVSALTNIQLFNRLEIGQEGKVFLPIPIQFPDGHFTVAQLLLHCPKEEKYEGAGKKIRKSVFKVAFLLELSCLGPIRADFTISRKDITGRFLLACDETRSIFEANIPSLIAGLKKRGFAVQSIECRIKDPEIVAIPLFQDITDTDGNINLVA